MARARRSGRPGARPGARPGGEPGADQQGHAGHKRDGRPDLMVSVMNAADHEMQRVRGAGYIENPGDNRQDPKDRQDGGQCAPAGRIARHASSMHLHPLPCTRPARAPGSRAQAQRTGGASGAASVATRTAHAAGALPCTPPSPAAARWRPPDAAANRRRCPTGRGPESISTGHQGRRPQARHRAGCPPLVAGGQPAVLFRDAPGKRFGGPCLHRDARPAGPENAAVRPAGCTCPRGVNAPVRMIFTEPHQF